MKVGQVVKKLRQDFAGTVFEGANGTRIDSAADFEDVIRSSKVDVPAMYCLIGDDIVEDTTAKGSNMTSINMIETLVVMIVLSAKSNTVTQEDEYGADPTNLIHDIKIALNMSLHGWNPHIDDINNGQEYGYCSKEFRYSNGGFFDFNREWYIYRQEYEMESQINAAVNGFGTENPKSIVDLLRIYSDIQPTSITPGEIDQPFSKVDFPPP